MDPEINVFDDCPEISYAEMDYWFEIFMDGIVAIDKSISQCTNTGPQFHDLKKTMKQITEDGLVLKEIIKLGTGKVIPAKSIVWVHYKLYFENKTKPFASTYRKGKPFKFRLGHRKVISGLSIGVSTMKKNEISKFILHSQYANGSIGHSPRILRGDNILCEVEIIDFIDSAESIKLKKWTLQAPFEDVMAMCNFKLHYGHDLFNRYLYKRAIAKYCKIGQIVHDLSVCNEGEEFRRNDFLFKLYLFVSLCYSRRGNLKQENCYSELASTFSIANLNMFKKTGVVDICSE